MSEKRIHIVGDLHEVAIQNLPVQDMMYRIA